MTKSEYNRLYRALAPGKCSAAQRRWRRANLEHCASYQRQYRQRHLEAMRAYDRERYKYYPQRRTKKILSEEDRALVNRKRRLMYNLSRRKSS